MTRSVSLVAAALIMVAVVQAQEKPSPFAMEVGLGFTVGVGRTGANLDTGWHSSIGAGMNFNRHVSALININTHLLGTTATVPGAYSVRGGHAVLFAATLDPVVHLPPGRRADVYVTGGGGLFHRGYTPASIVAGVVQSDYS